MLKLDRKIILILLLDKKTTWRQVSLFEIYYITKALRAYISIYIYIYSIYCSIKKTDKHSVTEDWSMKHCV